jgi:hypothetical protein
MVLGFLPCTKWQRPPNFGLIFIEGAKAMKKALWVAWCLGLMLAAGQAWAEEPVPNLVGTWESHLEVVHIHSAQSGHKNPLDKFLVVIQTQEGRSFHGYKQHVKGAKVVKEKISGVIYWDNKTLYSVDHDKGFNKATIVSPTEIEGVYLEEGKKAMAVLYKWKKIK